MRFNEIKQWVITIIFWIWIYLYWKAPVKMPCRKYARRRNTQIKPQNSARTLWITQFTRRLVSGIGRRGRWSKKNGDDDFGGVWLTSDRSGVEEKEKFESSNSIDVSDLVSALVRGLQDKLQAKPNRLYCNYNRDCQLMRVKHQSRWRKRDTWLQDEILNA